MQAYKPGKPRGERAESANFKRWTYAELGKREGLNLDVWAEVEDKSVVDVENLPGPDVIAEEIVEQLTSALAQF